MSERYVEIFKLHALLEDAGIPHEFSDVSWKFPDGSIYEKYAIGYPVHDLSERICSVIQGFNTYGEELDLLEIMGLLTKKEAEHSEVLGWLSAEEVFRRIEWHWMKTKEEVQ